LGDRLEKWIVYWLSRGGERGREKAFDRIWRLYHGRILYFVRPRAGADAEDLVQEIFIKVFRNLDRFDPSRSFAAWIFAIARHHCINHAARMRPVPRPFDGSGPRTEGPVETGDPESLLIADERNRIVGEALEALDADSREMAFLRYHEGLKTRQIAEVLGLAEGTVKSRLFAIRGTLKEALREHED
jgi:RNA polymerase sigma-70 factor, ECF subfamily